MVDQGLHQRLEELEARSGIGPTAIVIVVPNGSFSGDEDRTTWPEGVGREDITILHRQENVGPDGETMEHEEVLVPRHRPPKFRGGVVVLSEAEIAQIYASMPADIREREREYRREHDEPIPPLLQE